MNKKLMTLCCAVSMIAFAASANAKGHPEFPPREDPAFHEKMEARHEKMAEKLAKDLDLTEEQREQAKKIRKDGKEKIKPLMKEMKKIRKKMDKIREKNMKEFEEILTPDQKKKFEQIKEEKMPHKMDRRHNKHPKKHDVKKADK